MEIVIASDQDRENLFAEIRKDGQPWAEVILREDSKCFELTIYAPEAGETMVIPLTEFQQALAEAREALGERGYHEGA